MKCWLAALVLTAVAAAQSTPENKQNPIGSTATLSLPGDPRRMLLPLPEEEDWSFLSQASARVEPLDRLKYLPLGGRVAYVSFGGEVRFYLESFRNENFGQVPRTDTYPELRALVHADVHFNPHWRLFLETQSSEVFGRRGGPRPGVDSDVLDLIEGFGEWRSTAFDEDLKGPSLTVRAGRQQFDFGAGRLLSSREGPYGDGPNVLQGFDGVHGILRRAQWRADLFAAKPNEQRRGIFNDGWLSGQSVWGASVTRDDAPASAAGGVAVFYLGTRRPQAAYFAGIANEMRHSVGMRAFRANTPWAYDAEAIYQFGSFGVRNIQAWGVTIESSYTFRDAMWSPQPGFRVGANSGGFSKSTLGTFYVPFPRGAYSGNLSAIGPENTTGVEGVLALHPTRTVTITGGAFVFWRKSLSDGVYALPGYPVLPALNQKRRDGVQPVSILTWRATSHAVVNVAYEHFRRGDFIRSVPATRDIDYVALWAIYRF